jgi:hypothetical protein
MSDWVFNFPPLPETIAEATEFIQTEDDLRYPRKLVLYAHSLGISDAKNWYIQNEFSDVQRSLYSAIFKFYGNTILEEEVRIFASLMNKNTDEYLNIVQEDYLALQHDLQTLFKMNPKNLYYVNAIERRSLFIDVQRNRTSLQLTHIEPYQIPQFQVFKQFPSLRVSNIADASYQSASIVFWSNITKLNAIDPYGNLYLTSSLDLDALRSLLKNYPNYKDYFTERKKIKLILGGLVDLYTSLNQGVEQLRALMAERDELSSVMILDILEKQERVLSSRKPESILTHINAKIVKLNSVFLRFNASFVLSDSRKNSIDLKKLTDNFFYSDYLSARESVETGLKTKLGEILRVLQ